MSSESRSPESRVIEYLSSIQDPNADCPLIEILTDWQLQESENGFELLLKLPYASTRFGKGLTSMVESGLSPFFDNLPLTVRAEWQVDPSVNTGDRPEAIAGVKHIIAVASGKGGVGKSTSSVNLALALAAEGAKVGLLDADIYGPSQAAMLGVPAGTRPRTKDDKWMFPVEAHGIASMSMAYLVDEKQAMVWRGPMVTSALQQMLFQTLWGELDYLIVDMPPGTGDIQLTFSQKVPASGALIVTTPQDIALLDAVKGIEMFRKVNIPVLGILENMSMHVCSNCGHEEAIFGESGGSRVAEEYQTRIIGSMPLDLEIRQQSDNGEPVVISNPDSLCAIRYRQAALALAAEVAMLNAQSEGLPEIEISDD